MTRSVHRRLPIPIYPNHEHFQQAQSPSLTLLSSPHGLLLCAKKHPRTSPNTRTCLAVATGKTLSFMTDKTKGKCLGRIEEIVTRNRSHSVSPPKHCSTVVSRQSLSPANYPLSRSWMLTVRSGDKTYSWSRFGQSYSNMKNRQCSSSPPVDNCSTVCRATSAGPTPPGESPGEACGESPEGEASHTAVPVPLKDTEIRKGSEYPALDATPLLNDSPATGREPPMAATVLSLEEPGSSFNEPGSSFNEPGHLANEPGLSPSEPGPPLGGPGPLSNVPGPSLNGAGRSQSAEEFQKEFQGPVASLSSLEGEGKASGTDRSKVCGGNQELVQAETDFFMFTGYLTKYALAMLTMGAALETFVTLAGKGQGQGTVLWSCWATGVFLGCLVGAGQVQEGYRRCDARRVVVTGSTRGLGKALAREFLLHGDSVVVTSRSEAAVAATVDELLRDMSSLAHTVPDAALWLHSAPDPTSTQRNSVSLEQEAGARGMAASAEGTEQTVHGRRRVCITGHGSQGLNPSSGSQLLVGVACDVQSEGDVRALADISQMELGEINLWINNAGTNSGFKSFMESTALEVKQVVGTNLIGSMLCSREAFRVLSQQGHGGHIFNMEGAGSEGWATPKYAVYGSTKSAIRQFHYSLVQECRGSGVGIHTASPGMVLTDLLLTGSTLENKQAFNIVCEQPETVARALVPRMRAVKGSGKAINYLTPPRIILAIITAWLRRGRWFDDEGRAVYAAEADRLRALTHRQQPAPLSTLAEALPSAAWLSLLGSFAIAVYIVVLSGGELSG